MPYLSPLFKIADMLFDEYEEVYSGCTPQSFTLSLREQWSWMISFNYKLTSYDAFLQGLAKTLQVEMKENTLLIPDELGGGYLKSIEFNETDALIYAFTLNEDIVIKREKDENEYYTLIYDELQQPKDFCQAL